MFHTRGASLNMGNVFLPIPRLQNKALNIYLSSCCLITPNLALYWTEKFCSFSFWILSKISFTESFSTLLSQVNRRDGGNGIRGRSRDGGGQGRQNLPTHIERIKCKKSILGKTGRWASWGWRVGGLSQAFHNLGICWSAEPSRQPGDPAEVLRLLLNETFSYGKHPRYPHFWFKSVTYF